MFYLIILKWIAITFVVAIAIIVIGWLGLNWVVERRGGWR